MSYNIRLEGKNKVEAEDLLVEISLLLEQHHIQYYLEGGTLLGILRENRLLPWDGDLDLSIMSNQLENIDSFLSSLKQHAYRTRCRFMEEDNLVFKKNSLRIIKIRKKRFFGLIKSKVCLEIFVKYEIADKLYWKIGNKTVCDPKGFYDGRRTINFLNKSFPIPMESEAYLTRKYGDWKVPVKIWNAMEDDASVVDHIDI
jgi:phosphorylcholine metabolism protein LicD